MEHRDYLSKQVDQLAKVLGKLLADLTGGKNEGQIGESMERIRKTFAQELDLDIDKLLGLSDEEFIHKLIGEKQLGVDHLDKVAELFLSMADQTASADAASKKSLYQKSLALHQYLHQNETVYSLDRQYKMERIRRILG